MHRTERDLDYLPYGEVLPFQIARLHELMAGDWQKAPGFLSGLAREGVTSDDLNSPEDLRRFPVLKKSDLPGIQSQDPPFGGLITVPPGRLRRIFSSPGPIYDPEGRADSYFRWERAFAACGFKERDIVLNCFSYHLTPAGAMFEEGASNLGCAVIPAGIGNSEIQAQVAAHLKANAYVGLPSYLKVLLEKASEAGLVLSLVKAFVIAEMLPESLRKELQEVHGIRTRQGYGTAEVGAIAYECEAAEGMHFDPSVIVEILEPETLDPVPEGETGEVVVTVLNPFNTLLRFATGDLSRAVYDKCPCGRESPRLTGILGRVDQVTKVRGLFVHPSQLTQAASCFPEITRLRAVVIRERAMDDMILEIESPLPLPESALQAIGQKIRDVLKLGVKVVQVEVGTIPEDAKPLEDRRKWE